MTLSQMASAVRNHVVDGLDGVSATAFSMSQLRDEILQTTSAVIIKLAAQGLIDLSVLSQKIDGIRLTCKDLSSNCDVKSEISGLHFTIPNLNRLAAEPILYLGSVESSLSFKVYYGREYRYHKYRLSTSKKPFAWVSSTPGPNGLYDVFLFNVSKYTNFTFVSIDAIFDNPYDILKTDYYSQFMASEFYAPFAVQKEVIDTLTKQYVEYYRKLHQTPTPNTQQA